MKICTLKTLGKWCMYLALPLLSSITVAQTGGVIFYDDCEASNKPLYGGTNADISKAWNFKYTESNASISRSNAYSRKGSYSYKHTLSNPTQDTWEYLKAELCYNFSPAGVPSGTLGANNRMPSGIRWFAQSTLIPSSNNDYNTITNIGLTMKAWPDDYTTPSYLTMEQGRYYLFVTPVNSSLQAQAQRKFDCGPVIKDKWEDWVLHRNFTSRDSGYVELYKNGVLVASYYGGNFKDDAGHAKEAYMVTGLYKWAFRSGWSPAPDVNYVEMYTDEFRVGLHSAKLEDFIIDGSSTPPPSNQAPTASAGTNRSITLPTNTISLTGSGTDTDGTIASFRWSQVSGPNTATITNGSSATATFSNLVQGSYSFRLTVTDNGGATASATVTVTVNPAPVDNVAPVANAGSNRNITLPTSSTTLSGSGSDADGTVTAFRWRQINGPNTAIIANTAAASSGVSGLVQGTYTFRLTVTDNDGATHSDDMNVTVNAAPNQAPTVNAGRNISITLPTSTANLSGSATDDDGTIASYRWSQLNGPSTATIASATAAASAVSGLQAGVYTFRLTATDNDGASSTDDMTVTVNAAVPVNVAPVASAGRNRSITLPTTSTTLSGTGTDSDGTIASYLWSQVSGPSTAQFSAASAATTNATGLAAGTYVFRLTVTDNDGATGIDEVTVTVNAAAPANENPVANAGSNRTITLPTNSTTLSGSGTDSDGTIATYGWSQVSGPSTALINPVTAANTTVSGLVAGTYVFRLTITDNDGATDADEVTVVVNPAPVPNAAPAANAGRNRSISLPTNSVSLSGSGTDSDGTIATYRWSQVSGPSTALINPVAAANTTVSGLVAGTYVFRLTVTDNDGASDSDETTVVVYPAPVPNAAPSANAGSNRSLTLPTNSTTLSGSATDSDGTIAAYRWTQISGPNTATIATATAAATGISNMIEGSYVFRLTVTDNDGATDADDVSVTVNPAPAAAVRRAPVSNAGGKKTVNTKSTSLNGSSSYDPDGTIVSYNWTQLNGPNTATFSSARAATTDVSNLATGTYNFQLEVTDNHGLKGTSSMTLEVLPPPVAPVARAANKTISLPTNRVELDGTGSTDADGSIRSYRWTQQSGPATSSILAATSSKTVVSNLVAGTYQYQLEVTDNAGLKGTATVSVKVLPNRAPVIVTNDSVEVILPADTATLDASESYDPDGQIRLFQWKLVNGPSNAALRNQNTAVLNLSGLVAGIYTFEILIRDNGNITVRKEINVNVRGNSGKESLSMKLYPNPVASNGTLNLRLDDNSSGRGTVQFYSISGVLVQRDEINKQGTHFNKTYNISNFAAGTYVIRVQFDGMAPVTRKFQKQ